MTDLTYLILDTLIESGMSPKLVIGLYYLASLIAVVIVTICIAFIIGMFFICLIIFIDIQVDNFLRIKDSFKKEKV